MLTMEEALKGSAVGFSPGQIVKGKIIEVRPKEVLVDVGYKSEGTISGNEFDDIKAVKVGDEIDVLIEKLEDKDGMVVLSKEKAEFKKNWDRILLIAGEEKDAVPVLLELGLFLGQHDHAVLVFELLDEHVDFVADFHGLDVVEFVAGNGAFRLVADVYQHFLGADLDDFSFDDLAGGESHGAALQGLFHCEHNDLRTN